MDWTQVSHIAGRFFNLSHKGSLRILEWVAYPFSRDLPDPGIKPGSLALKADSFPSELQGSRPPPPIYTSPIHDYYYKFIYSFKISFVYWWISYKSDHTVTLWYFFHASYLWVSSLLHVVIIWVIFCAHTYTTVYLYFLLLVDIWFASSFSCYDNGAMNILDLDLWWS